MRLTASLVSLRFLIRWASSAMTTSQRRRAGPGRVVHVGTHDVVAGQREMLPGRPLPVAARRRSADDDRRQLRCPLGDLPTPLIEHHGGRHDQAGCRPPTRHEDPHRGDGLNGLAETHVVGQQQLLATQQHPHAVPLKRHQRAGPVQMRSRQRIACAAGLQHRPQAFGQTRLVAVIGRPRAGGGSGDRRRVVVHGTGALIGRRGVVGGGAQADHRPQAGDRAELRQPMIGQSRLQAVGDALQRLEGFAAASRNPVDKAPEFAVPARLRVRPEQQPDTRSVIGGGWGKCLWWTVRRPDVRTFRGGVVDQPDDHAEWPWRGAEQCAAQGRHPRFGIRWGQSAGRHP